MMVSQKCQYAIRAIFELAKRVNQGPSRIAEVAEAQAIPPRFLEVILSQLKQARFVESKRGNEGGYAIARDPAGLTVGEVIRFVECPIGPISCVAPEAAGERCALHGSCVFITMWKKVEQAMSDVYDHTTFADLIEQERALQRKFVSLYTI